jgi:hypothetical protein
MEPALSHRNDRAPLAAVACLDDYEGGRGALGINCLFMLIARYSVMFMAIGAFAMKDRSSITALQQLFDDTTSTLLANFRHK